MCWPPWPTPWIRDDCITPICWAVPAGSARLPSPASWPRASTASRGSAATRAACATPAARSIRATSSTCWRSTRPRAPRWKIPANCWITCSTVRPVAASRSTSSTKCTCCRATASTPCSRPWKSRPPMWSFCWPPRIPRSCPLPSSRAACSFISRVWIRPRSPNSSSGCWIRRDSPSNRAPCWPWPRQPTAACAMPWAWPIRRWPTATAACVWIAYWPCWGPWITVICTSCWRRSCARMRRPPWPRSPKSPPWAPILISSTPSWKRCCTASPWPSCCLPACRSRERMPMPMPCCNWPRPWARKRCSSATRSCWGGARTCPGPPMAAPRWRWPACGC